MKTDEAHRLERMMNVSIVGVVAPSDGRSSSFPRINGKTIQGNGYSPRQDEYDEPTKSCMRVDHCKSFECPEDEQDELKLVPNSPEKSPSNSFFIDEEPTSSDAKRSMNVSSILRTFHYTNDESFMDERFLLPQAQDDISLSSFLAFRLHKESLLDETRWLQLYKNARDDETLETTGLSNEVSFATTNDSVAELSAITEQCQYSGAAIDQPTKDDGESAPQSSSPKSHMEQLRDLFWPTNDDTNNSPWQRALRLATLKDVDDDDDDNNLFQRAGCCVTSEMDSALGQPVPSLGLTVASLFKLANCAQSNESEEFPPDESSIKSTTTNTISTFFPSHHHDDMSFETAPDNAIRFYGFETTPQATNKRSNVG
jgi:hypothetical protein